MAFVAYLRQLYGPVSDLANLHVDIMTSLALFERLFSYLDLKPEIADRPNALVPPPARGEIEFDHVSFGYVERRLALDDVSFTAKPGQLVALVGPSGAGKTTITYLVPRFYDPTGGAIRVDGHDVRDVSMHWLRSQIGMRDPGDVPVPRDGHARTCSTPATDATQAEVEAACRAANIHEFIAALPEGYETMVGERGYRLSGGEKQRLAIARVLLKDPRILLLDEATSSLDSRSEALIQAALTPLMEGRTSLVIAHRLSTILAADVILVLEHGRLVEQGTHAELLAQRRPLRPPLQRAVQARQERHRRERGCQEWDRRSDGCGLWPGSRPIGGAGVTEPRFHSGTVEQQILQDNSGAGRPHRADHPPDRGRRIEVFATAYGLTTVDRPGGARHSAAAPDHPGCTDGRGAWG